ncbi:hypothetical protein LTR56_026270 [Elasticomyces elasticus]|nr:hypothetical protein LTR56_026270 [Elasticomyces elasticus]KAK4920987.1 hypothetical protein LTR49_011531 [Elasticomyces elasticus]KAK5759508.1 hypothetical protein LTS12_010366 [Elasticomyces elasticus]
MSTLLALPPELRNRIWEYTVADIVTVSATQPYPGLPGILRTCRQTRKEAIGIWLLQTPFRLIMQDYDAVWLHKIYRPCMIKIITLAVRMGAFSLADINSTQTQVVYHGVPHWGNLMKTLEVVYGGTTGTCPMTHSVRAEVKVVMAAYAMVRSMRVIPWAEVKEKLEMWHIAIAAMDARWT